MLLASSGPFPPTQFLPPQYTNTASKPQAPAIHTGHTPPQHKISWCVTQCPGKENGKKGWRNGWTCLWQLLRSLPSASVYPPHRRTKMHTQKLKLNCRLSKVRDYGCASVPKLRSQPYREPKSVWHEVKVIVPLLWCTKKKPQSHQDVTQNFLVKGWETFGGVGAGRRKAGVRMGGMGENGRKWGGKWRIQSSTSLIQDRQSIPSPLSTPSLPPKCWCRWISVSWFCSSGSNDSHTKPPRYDNPSHYFFLDPAKE